MKKKNPVIDSLNPAKNESGFSESEAGIRSAAGHSMGFQSRKMDQQDSMHRMNRNMMLFFNTMKDLLFVLDFNGDFVEVNRAVVEMLGYEREELLDRDIFSIHFQEDEDTVARIFEEMKAGTTEVCPLPLRTKKGKRLEVETTIVPGYWNDREVFFGVSRDLTMTRELERIRYLCDHDSLTDLYNRTAFESSFQQLIDDGHFPFSILIMDIDGFRAVNEGLGHKEGDRVLKTFAKRIREQCRPEDLLSRWGGDEFAIILKNTGEEEAVAIAEKIKKNARVVLRDNIELNLSFGLATLGPEDQSMEKAIATAEDMMLRHKLFVDNSIQNAIIVSIQRTLQERNLETEEHTERMVGLANNFGAHLGLEKNQQNSLQLLATLHDIGKVGIPDKILLKEGSLTPEEWKAMKTHSAIGTRIAEATRTLSHIGENILCHHEKWDGTGYPRGISGEEISPACRILALVDAFDVMTHDRPYKKAISKEEALLEIRRCSGTQFDPGLAERFISFMEAQ